MNPVLSVDLFVFLVSVGAVGLLVRDRIRKWIVERRCAAAIRLRLRTVVANHRCEEEG